MALNFTSSWTPPPSSLLEFSNCTALSAYFASLVAYEETDDAGYNAILDYVRSLIPSNWTIPTNTELLVWYESWDVYTNAYNLNRTADMVQFGCGRRVCDFLPLEGDPDLAGLGIVASYYIVAILATIYFIVISLNCVTALNRNKVWKRFHSLFEQTLNSFLDAALLFSISMLLAAIYRFASASQRPDGEDNTFIYSLVNAVTMSMFSVFPPLVLQFTARGLRRRGIRVVMWFLVIAFVITVTVLYYRWRGSQPLTRFFSDESRLNDQIDHHVNQITWLILCDETNDRAIETLDHAIITAQVLLGLYLPCWIYLLFTISDAHQDDVPRDSAKNGLFHSKVWKRYEKWARTLNAVLCCVMMWLLLGTFKSIADRLADAMGEFGKDRRWSIGQILAMATFAPLLIDIITITLYEPRKALEGKLPTRFRVVEAEQPAEATYTKDSRRSSIHNGGGLSDYEMLEDGARRRRN